MRNASLLIAICCCLSAASADWSRPMTALPDERPVPFGPARNTGASTRDGAHLGISIGSLDTIGGTTYDRQFNGPVWRMIVDSRHGGIHAVWMYSYSADSLFPDRCMRYQFHDFAWGDWNWIDPDYMYSGVNVFGLRTGYGNVDSDTNGVAVISAHHATGQGSSDFAPIVARDAAVGVGIFDYSPGEPELDGFAWPCIGVGMNGFCQLAMIDASTWDDLYWSRLTGEGWEPPEFVGSPLFSTHNIATSKVTGSNRVCITWVVIPASGYGQDSGYYRETSDGGDNWGSPVNIGFPPAFHPSSDTLPSFHVTSLFPFYDNDDRLNIAASVHPYVNDTNYIVPSEIWHYCPDNTPQWNRIQIASCDPANMQGSVGYDAAYAGRPSIGQDDYGDLFVTWEQFDSANVESTTNRLRADIWASGSTDGGVSWSTPLKLTTPDSSSCRFPSICDLLWPGDSMAVLYEVDLCAGFFLFGEGPATDNPIVVQKVPADSIIQRGPYFGRLKEPNGGESLYVGDSFAIRWIAAPQTFEHGVLSLSTDGGATFATVLADSIPPADTVAWWGPIPPVRCSLCRVRFAAIDSLGDTVFSDASCRNFSIDSVYTGVAEERPRPTGVSLRGPTPNPFARATALRLVLPAEMPVEVAVYNSVGQRVRLLASGLKQAGAHCLAWDGTDERARSVPAGVYYVRVKTGRGALAQPVVLLR